MTLVASRIAAIRQFWIDHGIACRTIGAAFGRALGTPCVTNLWIPDGMKDTPVDRVGPRERLTESLDAIFKEPIDPSLNLDSVEGKLFGIGCESYTVGSHEYYFGYALTRHTLLTLDTGHYHPTETITDKISSVLAFLPEIAAARQPRRPLGQRPRRHPERRPRGAQPRAGPRRLPAAHAHRPRLLRRQHQPRRRVDHRHAQHAQGAAQGAARAVPQDCGISSSPATTRRGSRCSRNRRHCRSGRCGTTTANQERRGRDGVARRGQDVREGRAVEAEVAAQGSRLKAQARALTTRRRLSTKA